MLTTVGAAVGVFASIVAVRVLRASMYEMSVYDVPTFTAKPPSFACGRSLALA